MKPGRIVDLVLVPRDPIPWDREDEPGFGVDLVPGGDKQAAIVVFGTTEAEARQRAQDLIRALIAQRRGA